MSKLAAACNIDPEKRNNSLNSQPGCIEVAYHKVVHVSNANYYVLSTTCVLQICQAHTHTHAHTHARTRMHAHTHTHAHTQHAHAYIHTHTPHAHAHTYIHTHTTLQNICNFYVPVCIRIFINGELFCTYS